MDPIIAVFDGTFLENTSGLCVFLNQLPYVPLLDNDLYERGQNSQVTFFNICRPFFFSGFPPRPSCCGQFQRTVRNQPPATILPLLPLANFPYCLSLFFSITSSPGKNVAVCVGREKRV